MVTAAFLAGALFSLVICLIIAIDEHQRTEKRGIWTNGDRAYKLVRIEK